LYTLATPVTSARMQNAPNLSATQLKEQTALEAAALKDFNKAEQLFLELTNEQPEVYLHKYNLSVLYSLKQEYAKGLAYAARAEEIEQTSSQIKLQIAKCHEGLGSHEKAIKVLEKITDMDQVADYWYVVGVCLEKNGMQTRAIQAYTKAHELDPNNEYIILNLSTLLTSADSPYAALDILKNSEGANRASAKILHNIGITYLKLDLLKEAKQYFQKTIEAEAYNPEAYSNVGLIYMNWGRPREALHFFSIALLIEPSSSLFLVNSGVAYEAINNFSMAELCYRKALSENNKNEKATIGLSNLYFDKLKNAQEAISILEGSPLMAKEPSISFNLGNIYSSIGQGERAAQLYETSISINPEYVDAIINLGVYYEKRGLIDNSRKMYEQVLIIDNKNIKAIGNLGHLYSLEGNFNRAVDFFEKGRLLDISDIGVRRNLANTFYFMGDLENAQKEFEELILANPLDYDSQYGMATVYLSKGNYAKGWELYESRFNTSYGVELNGQTTLNRWTPSRKKSGKPVAIIAEQGVGDTLQFMRYCKSFSSTFNIEIVLIIPSNLHGLAKSSKICDAIESEIDNTLYDSYVPLMSIPFYLSNTNKNNFPPKEQNEPYVRTPTSLIDSWREKLISNKRPIVGLHWQGNPKAEKGALQWRSFPLSMFNPILDQYHNRCSFISLQKGPGSEQLVENKNMKYFSSSQKEVDGAWDFEETAALVMNCDLIITNDTYLPHLAGGLGKQCWLILSKIPEWRWGRTGSLTHWYPTLTLFRQKILLDWEPVFSELTEQFDLFLDLFANDVQNE